MTAIAEQAYESQKPAIIEDIKTHILESIEKGEAQIKNGEFESFDSFQARFRAEHLTK